jgi:hypothetical protein
MDGTLLFNLLQVATQKSWEELPQKQQLNPDAAELLGNSGRKRMKS